MKRALCVPCQPRIPLQICGYGCLDHFLEVDTYTHSWEALHSLLADESCHGILIDVGMPIQHKNNRYNWYRLVSPRTPAAHWLTSPAA